MHRSQRTRVGISFLLAVLGAGLAGCASQEPYSRRPVPSNVEALGANSAYHREMKAKREASEAYQRNNPSGRSSLR